MARARDYLSLARPVTLAVPLVFAVLFGLLAMKQASLPVNWLLLLFSGLSLAAANGGSNIANQIADLEGDKLSKPNRPLPSGRVSVPNAMTIMFACYLGSIILAFLVSSLMGILVGIILILTWVYSFPPRLRDRLFVGNLNVAGPRGGLGLIAAYAGFASPWRLDLLLFAVIMGLLAFSQAISKDVGVDEEADRKTGVKNIVNTYGTSIACWVMMACGLAALPLFGLLLFFGVFPMNTMLAFLGIVVALQAAIYITKPWKGDNNLGWAIAYLGMGLTALGFVLPQVI